MTCNRDGTEGNCTTCGGTTNHKHPPTPLSAYNAGFMEGKREVVTRVKEDVLPLLVLKDSTRRRVEELLDLL